jgi:hypothetical protein
LEQKQPKLTENLEYRSKLLSKLIAYQSDNVKVIRFLLHGDSECYNRQETLYKRSQQLEPVWDKVAKQVLSKWQILEPSLVNEINGNLCKKFSIEEISLQNLISEMDKNPDALKDLEFNSQERTEILKQVSIVKENLWRNLPLHETVDKKLVKITESTYRENPNFPLDREFANLITLLPENIQRNDWVTQWDFHEALKIGFQQSNLGIFCQIFMNIINFHELDKEELSKLRTISWLILKNGKTLSPEKLVILSPNFDKDLGNDIAKLFEKQIVDYACKPMLKIRVNEKFTKNLCKPYYEDSFLQFLLEQIISTSVSHDYSLIILKLLSIMELRKQTISHNNKNLLKSKKWLIDEKGDYINSQYISNLPKLECPITDIFKKLSNWDYRTISMLSPDLHINEYLHLECLQELFISGNEAIKIVGQAMSLREEFYIGDLGELSDDLVKSLWDNFQTCELMPSITLCHSNINLQEFKDFILPYIAKPIQDNERLSKILQWLSDNKNHPQLEIINLYNLYLKMYTDNNNNDSEGVFLLEIKLLNQEKQWESPAKLCDGKRHTKIDLSVVLDSSQRKILTKYLDECSHYEVSRPSPSSLDSSAELSEETDAQKLERYFCPWLSIVPSETIGGLLCLLAGTNLEIQNLAKKYLQSRNFDGARERLLWSDDCRERNFQISLKEDKEEPIKVSNLFGEDIEVPILRNGSPEHIFVGQLPHFLDKLDHNPRKLTLLTFAVNEKNYRELNQIIINSAKQIIECVHRTKLEESVEAIWQDFSNS